MTNNAGIWIDHHKAVVVHLTNEGEKLQQLTSDGDNRTEAGEGARVKHAYTRNDFQPEDKRDRKEMIHFNEFYDQVIASLREADTILVMGPGEAKGEFVKRLESKKLKLRIAEVKTMDKMTDPQISAYVKEHFQKA